MASSEVLLTFQLGRPLGMKLGKNSLEVGIVNRNGQATDRGVKLGWKVLGLKDKDCSTFAEFAETLDALRAEGETSCEVRFRTEKTAAMAAVKTKAEEKSSAKDASADIARPEDGPELEGVLELKDSSISGAWDSTPDSWKSRWFKASKQHLKYYNCNASPGSRESYVRKIDLKRCAVLDVNKSTNGFRVLVKGEEHLELQASSLADAQHWVDTLLTLIERSSTPKAKGVEGLLSKTSLRVSERSSIEPKEPSEPTSKPPPEAAPDLESSEKPVNNVLSFFGLGSTSGKSVQSGTEKTAAVKTNAEEKSSAQNASADIARSEDGPELEGVLELKDSSISGAWDSTPDSWKSRWFKASKQHLKYYNCNASPGRREKCAREVDLKRCTVLDVNKSTNGFRVLVKGEEHLELRASSLADAQHWVDTLLALIERSSTSKLSPAKAKVVEESLGEPKRRVSEHLTHVPEVPSKPNPEPPSDLDQKALPLSRWDPTSEPTLKPLPKPALEASSELKAKPLSEPTPERTSEPTSEPTLEPALGPESSETPVDNVLSLFGLGSTSGEPSPEVSNGTLESQVKKRPTVEELFQMLAVNPDGELTKADVVNAADYLGLTREEAVQVFEELDADGSGKLAQENFLGMRKLKNALTQLLTPPEDEKKKYAFSNAPQETTAPTLSQLFSVLDKNGDGKLTKDEVVSGADSLGMTTDAAAELFDKLDSSGSGTLSKDDFGLMSSLSDLVANLFVPGLMKKETPLAIIDKEQSSSPDVAYPDLDSDTFEIIENLAHAVTKHGSTFETSVREKQAENPQYAFLREAGIPAYEYYAQCKEILTEKGWSLDEVRSQRKCATEQDLFATVGGIFQSIVVSDAKYSSEASQQTINLDELFAKVDINNDGELTKDEVVGAAEMLGMTPAEAATLFDSLDTSGNGKLTKEEFSFLGDIVESLKEAMPNPEEWIDNCIDLIAGDKRIANEAANDAPNGASYDAFASQATMPEKASSRLDSNRVTEEAWYEGLVGDFGGSTRRYS